MDQNIQHEQEEFTFKKFFDLLKRSGKRILVYAIIAAVIGLCLAAVIAVTTMGGVEYRGVVEFTHGKIIDGLDPNGNVLDYNRIKSASIINGALANMGYSEEEINGLTDRLEGDLVIVPYIPKSIAAQMAENPSVTYHPTRYTVVLAKDKKLNMSNSQSAAFINELMKVYVEYFKQYYNYKIDAVAAPSADIVTVALDYYDAVYNYNNELDSMKSAIAALPDSYSGIAGMLYSRINVLASYLTELETYILTRNVQKEGVAMSLSDNVQNKINNFTTEAAAYKLQSESLDVSIEKYQQMFESIIVGSDNKITISSADATAYNALVAEKKNAVKQQSVYESNAALLTRKKALINDSACTAEDRAYVENGFKKLSQSFNETVDKINEELVSFADKQAINSSIKIVNNGYQIREISYLASIVSFVVVVLVGIIAAVVVTSVKEKKREKMQKKAEAEEAIPAQN